MGASLKVMERDAKKMRGERPFVFTNLKNGGGAVAVEQFIIKQGLLGSWFYFFEGFVNNDFEFKLFKE